MASYQITLKDKTTESIDDADAYAQEGQMTTFFLTGSDRQVVDTWSTRVASFRTSELIAIRRVASSATFSDGASSITALRTLERSA